MTISNCNTCGYYSNKEPGTKLASAHCYMFREAPEGVCRVHTGYKGNGLVVLEDVLETFLKKQGTWTTSTEK